MLRTFAHLFVQNEVSKKLLDVYKRQCKNCDVSLTYHKGLNQLTCHYCGYTYQVPRSCPACGDVYKRQEKRWGAFADMYQKELKESDAAKAFIDKIKAYSTVTLLYA